MSRERETDRTSQIKSTIEHGGQHLKSESKSTLLSSASSPSIAASLLKKEAEKKQNVPKGLKASASTTSIVSNWILAPLERLNHTTADFEVYAGSPPDDSSESPHYFNCGAYLSEQQESRKVLSQFGETPTSEMVAKLMPYAVSPITKQQMVSPRSVKPSFDSLSQLFDNSSNEPSPNASPMSSPRGSPFLGRRFISPDRTSRASETFTAKELGSSAYRGQNIGLETKYPLNADVQKVASSCVASSDKKSKSPQTFKFNVANFDLNAVGPSSW